MGNRIIGGKIMFNIFDENNVNEVINKRPLIVSWSNNGSSGPMGLMLVIFDDGSSYGYSTLYKYRDDDLIKEIVESVPEFKTLMCTGKEKNVKREPYKDDMRLTYLGLGNIAYIQNDIFEDFLNLDGKSKYTVFKEKVKELSQVDIWDIAKKVREHFHGVIF